VSVRLMNLKCRVAVFVLGLLFRLSLFLKQLMVGSILFNFGQLKHSHNLIALYQLFPPNFYKLFSDLLSVEAANVHELGI
jgi:hypothetical protein